MIELFTADTPNGKKISIMLEEIGYDYKVTKVDLNDRDQFKPEFIKISPFSKIPVIIDHDNKIGKFCSIGPGSTIGGKVKINDYSAIALGSSVIQEISIGGHVVVGAHSLILNNVMDNTLVYGVPAKEIRKRNPGDKYL